MVGQMKRKLEVHFISFVGPNYSRSSTLLNFTTPAVTKKYVQINQGWIEMCRQFLAMRVKLREDSVLIVMSPSHKATFPAKLLTGKKVILDAGWPLTDGVLSRSIGLKKIPKLVQSYFLDLVSFRSADLILVESHEQIRRIARLFGIPKNRLKVSFTGVNETAFSISDAESGKKSKVKIELIRNPEKLCVLFRGRINKEAGITNIIAAAEELEAEVNFIIVTGKNNILDDLPSNCFLYSEISDAELKKIYSISDITLGQISEHRRLKYTIPHKAFEAGYFGKTYVTPKSPSLLELYPGDSAYFIEDASVISLVKAIRKLQDSKLRKKNEVQISERYSEVSSQSVLNSNFERILLEIQSE